MYVLKWRVCPYMAGMSLYGGYGGMIYMSLYGGMMYVLIWRVWWYDVCPYMADMLVWCMSLYGGYGGWVCHNNHLI